MRRTVTLLMILCFSVSCTKMSSSLDTKSVTIDTLQGTSLLGETLIRRQVNPETDSLQIANYLKSLDNYKSNPMSANYIIWLGRRIAYLGDYQKAITIYTEGVNKFPDDARMYRHRGHRYISTRQLDKAIADFEKAVQLIESTEDVIEPDGIPNRLNQPVSSLHTNVYYHLGLAYYLKNDLELALLNFNKCLDASQNDDMVVASKHWLYMIQRRLNNEVAANDLLVSVTANMNIIENDGYHQLLLFYKGELTEDDLKGNDALGSTEAVQYGIANWYHYNGDTEVAIKMYTSIIKNGNWAAFGYIAAEADLSRQ